MVTRNVPEIQAALDRVTTEIERWTQDRWCDLAGEVDAITENHLETLTYHDFELTPEFAAWYRDLGSHAKSYVPLPIADCGTSYCVAGNVVVANGYVFMGEANDTSASRVIKRDRVVEFMKTRSTAVENLRDAPSVATEILGLTQMESTMMFAHNRSLPELWGIAYAVTRGQITLPETLPESTYVGFNGAHTVPATDTAIETRRVIFEALKNVARVDSWYDWQEIALRELDKLSATSAT